jgi:hypothetical protein
MSVDVGSGLSATAAGLASSFGARLVCGATVLRTEICAEEIRWTTVGDAGHEFGIWSKLDCCGAGVAQCVPGHEGGLPVELGRCGGALG